MQKQQNFNFMYGRELSVYKMESLKGRDTPGHYSVQHTEREKDEMTVRASDSYGG